MHDRTSKLRSFETGVKTLRHLIMLVRSAWRSLQKFALTLPLAIAIGIGLAIAVHALPTPLEQPPGSDAASTLAKQDTLAKTPAPLPLKPHPLPSTLAKWHDPQQSGDYFDQIKTVPVGYLIWSHFPVTVYIQPQTTAERAIAFTAQRSQAWIDAVAESVREWNQYLPLAIVSQADGADITIERSPPPLQLESSAPLSQGDASGQVPEKRPMLSLGRVRSAVTRYELYAKRPTAIPSTDAAPERPSLAHRFIIQLRLDQAPQYLHAAARHELGHALGLWGHSLSQTDVMYFSQVRQPPPISPRDVNTLKRVYEQPTRLNWAVSS